LLDNVIDIEVPNAPPHEVYEILVPRSWRTVGVPLAEATIDLPGTSPQISEPAWSWLRSLVIMVDVAC
jgi:hypothetical protein